MSPKNLVETYMGVIGSFSTTTQIGALRQPKW